MSQARPFTILIVDDSEDDLLLMREAFTGTTLQPEIFEAGNADAALKFLRNNGSSIDLVILDINMPPGLSGLELLEELQKDKTLSSIPVMMMTTSALDSDVNTAFENGASAFITKPLEFKELQSLTQRLSDYWSTAASERGNMQLGGLSPE